MATDGNLYLLTASLVLARTHGPGPLLHEFKKEKTKKEKRT